MQNTFDNWQGSGEELEHHGIKGMKWGVRRYQNEDGTLTATGKSRYGVGGTGASARKMQRDFNNLDRGYANVEAERQEAARTANRYSNKILRRAAKNVGKDASQEQTREFINSDKRSQKYVDKVKKAIKKVQLTEEQKKSIENLQMRIIANAADKGYTVKSKEVLRIGNTQRQRVAALLASASLGGGALGGALIGGIMGASGTQVHGQSVKIRKKGDGKQQLVNYYNVNHPVGERREQRRRHKAG